MIQGTCSKGTDETVLTKFVTVTDGQTGQKQYIITVYMNIFERLLFFQKMCECSFFIICKSNTENVLPS